MPYIVNALRSQGKHRKGREGQRPRNTRACNMCSQTAWSQFLHRWIRPLFGLLSIWLCHLESKSFSLLSPSHSFVLLLFSNNTMKLCVCRQIPTDSSHGTVVLLCPSDFSYFAQSIHRKHLYLLSDRTFALIKRQLQWLCLSHTAAECPDDAKAGSAFSAVRTCDLYGTGLCCQSPPLLCTLSRYQALTAHKI